MVKMRKPSAREFQYERPICLVMGGACSDSCEQIDVNGERKYRKFFTRMEWLF